MLPSKYAPGGLSAEQSSRTLTTGRRRPQKPVNYTLKTIESRINTAAEKSSEDIEMIPMDDFQEVEAISDYVVHRRNHGLTSDEAMDLDFETEFVEQAVLGYAFLIVDTNFMLSHLNILNDLKETGEKYKIKVVIPIAAIKELDGLKKSTRVADMEGELSGKSVGHLARWANDWIYAALATNNGTVVGQKLSQRIDKFATQDDAILDCCLFYQTTYPTSLVVMLSNDKNLCLKALANEVLTVSYRPGMNAKLIGEMVLQENHRRNARALPKLPIELMERLHSDHSSPVPTQELYISREATPGVSSIIERFDLILSEMQRILIAAIDKGMRTGYGDDLELIRDYDKNKLNSFNDVLRVFELFWLPVFSSYFRRSPISFSKAKKEEYSQYIKPALTTTALIDFVGFWLQVLKGIYKHEMNQTENDALEKLIQRWKGLAQTS